jgi:hypothetical protein
MVDVSQSINLPAEFHKLTDGVRTSLNNPVTTPTLTLLALILDKYQSGVLVRIQLHSLLPTVRPHLALLGWVVQSNSNRKDTVIPMRRPLTVHLVFLG